jgi:hypothetical protein
MGNCGPGLRAMQLHCLLDTRTRCWGSKLLQGRRLGTANRKVHRQGFDDLSQKSPRLFQMEHRAPLPCTVLGNGAQGTCLRLSAPVSLSHGSPTAVAHILHGSPGEQTRAPGLLRSGYSSLTGSLSLCRAPKFVGYAPLHGPNTSGAAVIG